MAKAETVTKKTTISYESMITSKKLSSFFDEEEE